MSDSLAINDGFKALIPPLSAEEYGLLEGDLIANGCRDRIVTWDGVILDGHNRFEICGRHNIKFQALEMKFPDESDARIWIIQNQFARRNLDSFTRAVLALKLEPLLKAKAKEKQDPKKSWEPKIKAEKDEEIKKIFADPALSYDAKMRLADDAKIRFGREARRSSLANKLQVYVATTGSKIKIGVSIDPDGRIAQLKTSDPDIQLIEVFPGDRKLENAALKKFQSSSLGGDWFKPDGNLLSKLLTFIKKESRRSDEVTTQLSKSAGISHDTLRKAKLIEAKASEEVKSELRAGNVSINEVFKKLTVHVGQNSGENEWYTPPEYIAAARTVMGGINCDPASSEIANKTVKAEKFFTKEDDGLKKEWCGSVWMNPPYAQPLIGQFAEAVADKFRTGEIKQACVLVNNATETAWFQGLLLASSSICFPAGRIKFLDQNGDAKGAPLQGQAIIYFGQNIRKFQKAFDGFGPVLSHDYL